MKKLIWTFIVTNGAQDSAHVEVSIPYGKKAERWQLAAISKARQVIPCIKPFSVSKPV